MLDIERTFFEEHKTDLIRKFPGKFVVIKDRETLGGFDSIQDALTAGTKEFGLSSFLVRRTDEITSEISIPALTLGILRADTPYSASGSGQDS